MTKQFPLLPLSAAGPLVPGCRRPRRFPGLRRHRSPSPGRCRPRQFRSCCCSRSPSPGRRGTSPSRAAVAVLPSPGTTSIPRFQAAATVPRRPANPRHAFEPAISRMAFEKGLRPQPLPTKVVVIALLGMAANVPLGIWREHTTKFSVQWFAAVHAAVPFIGMLRKSILMTKSAMALTVAASILGQTIGPRAERIRLKRAKLAAEGHVHVYATHIEVPVSLKTGSLGAVQFWDPLALRVKSSVSLAMVPTVGAIY